MARDKQSPGTVKPQASVSTDSARPVTGRPDGGKSAKEQQKESSKSRTNTDLRQKDLLRNEQGHERRYIAAYLP